MKDGVPPEKVTDEMVSQYLYTAGVPDPDLVIPHLSELCVSNFLIWQAAYSESDITPTYLASFGYKKEYWRALEAYGPSAIADTAEFLTRWQTDKNNG